MSTAPQRTAYGHEMAARSRLGKARVIGGLKQVTRERTSDWFVEGLWSAKEADARKRIMDTAKAVADRAAAEPLNHAPAPSERVKVRWTDEMIAQLRREARWCKSNEALTRKLGLPEYCLGSIERGRRRYAPDLPATLKRPPRRQIESPAPDLKRAA